MLSDRHDRRTLKLGEMLTERKEQLKDHNAGRRRLSGEVRRKRGQKLFCCVWCENTNLLSLRTTRAFFAKLPTLNASWSR
jgi:hypothetical protein